MERGLSIAVGTAIVVAGLTGCSEDSKGTSPSSSVKPSGAATSSAVTSSAPATSLAPLAAGETRVVIAGQPQNVSGPVVCDMSQGRFSIAIGDMITGVIVGLEPDASAVHNAGLGNIDGVVLSFTEGAPGNSATATKDGKAYQITGTATGVDNAGQQVSKPFEVDATCP